MVDQQEQIPKTEGIILGKIDDARKFLKLVNQRSAQLEKLLKYAEEHDLDVIPGSTIAWYFYFIAKDANQAIEAFKENKEQIA